MNTHPKGLSLTIQRKQGLLSVPVDYALSIKKLFGWCRKNNNQVQWNHLLENSYQG